MSLLDNELIKLLTMSAQILNPVLEKSSPQNGWDCDGSCWLNYKDFPFFTKEMYNYFDPVSQFHTEKCSYITGNCPSIRDSFKLVPSHFFDNNVVSQDSIPSGECLNSDNNQIHRTNQCIGKYGYQEIGYEGEWTCPYFGYSYNLEKHNQFSSQRQFVCDCQENQVCTMPVINPVLFVFSKCYGLDTRIV